MSSEDILEAYIKIRQGKKWKRRYCVLHKLSGNTNCCAFLEEYKNEKKRRNSSTAKNKTVSLENYYGTESGFVLGKETETLAIICHTNVVILAFDSQERLVQWDIWIRNAFGCGCQFRLMVIAAPQTTSLVDRQNVRMHLQDGQFCLTADTPPRIVAEFRLKDIRSFGPVQNRFCFEAGSRSGDYAGCYVLLSSQTEQINLSFTFALKNALHNHLSKKLTVLEPVEVTKNNFAQVGVMVKDSGIRVLDVSDASRTVDYFSNYYPDIAPSTSMPNIDLDEVSLSSPVTYNGQNNSNFERSLPVKRSVRTQRRLRDDLARPVSGLYSCYDGEPESPFVMLPLCGNSPKPSLNSTETSSTSDSPETERKSCTKQTTVAADNKPISNNDASYSLYVVMSTQQQRTETNATPTVTMPPQNHHLFRTSAKKHWTPISAPPTRLERSDNIFKFPPPKSTTISPQSTQLNYCELATSTRFLREGHSEPLPFMAVTPKSAFLFPSTPFSPTSFKSGIEYAKIDEVRTLAVMKNTTARAVERCEKWPSAQTLSSTDSGKETKPSKRTFMLRPNLLRRRTSLTSLNSTSCGSCGD